MGRLERRKRFFQASHRISFAGRFQHKGTGAFAGVSKKQGRQNTESEMRGIEFIQDFGMELLLSAAAAALAAVVFYFIGRSRDMRGADAGAYTVYIPVGGRTAIFTVSMLGLCMGVLCFYQATTDAVVLGSVALAMFLIAFVRTCIYCFWKLTVVDAAMTLHRFLRRPCTHHFDEITLVSQNSRGYSVYAGQKELFNFSLGNRKTCPGAHMLKKELEEMGKWIHH